MFAVSINTIVSLTTIPAIDVFKWRRGIASLKDFIRGVCLTVSDCNDTFWSSVINDYVASIDKEKSLKRKDIRKIDSPKIDLEKKPSSKGRERKRSVKRKAAPTTKQKIGQTSSNKRLAPLPDVVDAQPVLRI
jgi:hypothetical protein